MTEPRALAKRIAAEALGTAAGKALFD